MANKGILDTDILSEILAAKNSTVMKNASTYVREHQFLTFTSVTLYEILTGLEQIQANQRAVSILERLNKNEEIVPASDDFQLAAKILGNLRRTGREVAYSDPLIAACAIRRNLTLITGNQKHFGFIKAAGFNLKLSNWR